MKYCIIILFLGPIIAQDIDLLFEYGNQLFINGRFDDAIDKYEKDGIEREYVDIVADNVQMLDRGEQVSGTNESNELKPEEVPSVE